MPDSISTLGPEPERHGAGAVLSRKDTGDGGFHG